MTELDQSAGAMPILSDRDRLALGLRVASQAFDPADEDGGRLSVIMTLLSLNDFMKATFGVEEPHLFVPLHQLQYALHDLNNGKTGSLLKAKKIENRPPNSTSVEGFRAFAAVAMDLFIEGGVPRKQAAHDVAIDLRRSGYTLGPGKIITAKQVEDWRDRVLQESPAENPAAARFQRMREALRDKHPDNPTAAARFLLERLPAVVPIPKKPAS